MTRLRTDAPSMPGTTPRPLAAVPLLGAVLAVAPLGASAGGEVDVQGTRFAARHEVQGQALDLRGAGVLRWRALVCAYAAALYLPVETSGGDALADVPKRLEIEYFWPIDAEDFGRAADALLAGQLSSAELRALRDRLDDLHARFESVEPGDRYALTYVPGVGTELAKNGRPLAVITGSDFAEAYFGIWLGDEPLDIRLRDRLRGGTTQRARN
ncbi:MAG: hypothetical protein DCC71_10735 [Proteobacteria bacterium]|nr:MAG: hypothetical protein DCC71_10735 [Pseudomonadota bacterium]